MRFDALNRLRHLGAIRGAKNAAALDASDRASDLRARLMRAEGRRRQIETEFHPREAVERLDVIDREIETIREELTDAEGRRAEAGAAFKAAAAVHETARRYAAEHGLPMPSEDAAEVGGFRWPEPPKNGGDA